MTRTAVPGLADLHLHRAQQALAVLVALPTMPRTAVQLAVEALTARPPVLGGAPWTP